MLSDEGVSAAKSGLRRNPDWTREETILALELYFRDRPRLLDDRDPQVVEISELLLLLGQQRGISGLPSFRNPAGVAMKVANLSRLDQEFKSGRVGLKNGSALEVQIWREFGGNPENLKRIAASIRRDILNPKHVTTQGDISSETTAFEQRPDPSRIWVTGMWGFTPDAHGYVGFTNPGGRDRYLKLCRPGDLMMIIGQNGETADPRDVGRLLGLVELDPRAVDESDRMSSESYVRKVAKFGAARWRYAMPVLRAWKITREVKAVSIAPKTCAARNARAIGSSCLLFEPFEVAKILELPSKPTRVWGQPNWASEIDEAFREERVRVGVKRGPKPFVGHQSHERNDGETRLYIMRLMGPVATIFDEAMYGKTVVKIGISNDVKRRSDELNWAFPPKCNLRWEPLMTQRFECGEDAFDAETMLLNHLESKGYRLAGREFAIVPEKEVGSLMAQVSMKSAFLIKGATRR